MPLSILTVEGNLGKDPEIKYAANGQEFCHFPLAVNNNKTKQTSWYNISCTGGLVKVATDYLKKGDPVLLIGRLTPREYTHNGVKGVSLDVFANVIDLIGNKTKESSSDEDPTDFDTEKFEEELAESSNSKSPDTSTNNKATAAPKAK